MQLEGAERSRLLRRRIGVAACALIAAGASTAAHAEGDAAWNVDSSLLLYGEQDRADVVEPIARITRQFSSGHRVSAQFAYDAITGASPTGALPSGQVQTTTTPSGNTATVRAGEIPTIEFSDQRFALDTEWQAPVSRTFTTTLGGHYSTEKDYRSLGASATFSLDLMQRLTTLTAGAGYNADEVTPVGGTRTGLTDGTVTVLGVSSPKTVTTGMVGFSRVLTRRWLVGMTGAGELERGYLTEPYKVVSLVDPVTGDVTGQLTEKRPSTRQRASLLASSAYHFESDVLYLSFRAYRDDWDVRSGTADLRLRHELGHGSYLQPHVRYYAQTAARFYVAGLVDGEPLPDYASSDYRLGPLRTATIGLTYGFHVPGLPGTLSLRAEYLRQSLAGQGGGEEEHEEEPEEEDDAHLVRAGPVTPTTLAAPPIPSNVPALNIASLLVGYTIQF